MPTTDGMTFSHFSSKPVQHVYHVKQGWRYEKPSSHDKPRGLWVSVDGKDDWPSWCEAESFGCGSIRHRVEIDLSKILLVSTKLELEVFDERYGRPYVQYVGYWEKYIDWATIASEYAGIVIAPYQWEHRLDMNWYYGWDCASGCVWDASAVKGIEAIREAA